MNVWKMKILCREDERKKRTVERYKNEVVINDVKIVSLTPVLAFFPTVHYQLMLIFFVLYSFPFSFFFFFLFIVSEWIGKKETFLSGGIFQIRCTGKMAFLCLLISLWSCVRANSIPRKGLLIVIFLCAIIFMHNKHRRRSCKVFHFELFISIP